MKGECPACFHEITLDPSIELGEVIFCDDCNVTLAVVGIGNGSVRFEIAESIEEDWGE